MAKISPAALAEVHAALDRYEEEVSTTALTPSTKDTYLTHASHFVRWLAGDFDPGEREWSGREREGGGSGVRGPRSHTSPR